MKTLQSVMKKSSVTIMECRQCGACCIAPSISTTIPGTCGGKPAGARCRHLAEDHRCGIYEFRPPVCREYTPTVELCGSRFDEAMERLAELERMTSSGA
jgi:hypothetical protein